MDIKQHGEHTVTSPLAEDGNDDVAGNTVPGGTIPEQSTVIPPPLVGTVQLEILLVFAQLEVDPDTVLVALAMVLREDTAALLTLAVDVQPTRRLGQKPHENDDDAGEEDLKPDGNDPGVGSLVVKGTAYSTGSEDGTGEPEGVV